MTTPKPTNLSLLGLPTEIRLLIWKYAFGNAEIPLYLASGPDDADSWNDYPDCEECLKAKSFEQSSLEPTLPSSRIADQVPRLTRAYTEEFESLVISKQVYAEALEIFRSSLTFHIKSSESLAFLRQYAPLQLRNSITKLMLYIHFTKQNEVAWYVRLLQLNDITPNLRHLAINYHMRPPSSYDNLANAIYMSMPLLALNPPFNRPLYVVKEQDRTDACVRRSNGRTIPCTDPQPGVTIHTAYRRRSVLFSSDFLGEITTDDAIDEHTAVIRALFINDAYTTAAEVFIASDTCHRGWGSLPPYQIPRVEVPGELINIRGGRALYESLLHVAHQLEKPWFEKLQKRKVLELYMEYTGMMREDAEELLERQIEGMGDGAISIFLESLMEGDEIVLQPGPHSDD